MVRKVIRSSSHGSVVDAFIISFSNRLHLLALGERLRHYHNWLVPDIIERRLCPIFCFFQLKAKPQAARVVFSRRGRAVNQVERPFVAVVPDTSLSGGFTTRFRFAATIHPHSPPPRAFFWFYRKSFGDFRQSSPLVENVLTLVKSSTQC